MTPHLSSSPVIGIDVSQAHLEICVHDTVFTYPYRLRDLPALVARLRAYAPGRIVVEATGGLERPLLQALCAAGLPVTLVNPYRVRLFARSLGQWAKTDRLDAQVLVRYGESAKLPLLVLPRPEQQTLKALVVRRRQVIDLLLVERNRLRRAPAEARASVEWVLARLEEEVQRLEASIRPAGGRVWRGICPADPGAGGRGGDRGDPAGRTTRTGASEREADCHAGGGGAAGG
jgi:transposase